MSLLDRVRGKASEPSSHPVPAKVADRIKRGREAMRDGHAIRRLCHKFWTNQQYWFVNRHGNLDSLSTSLFDGPGGKPQHRIRNQYPFIHMIVEGKVSAATQRVPGYGVTPSTTDPQDYAAARLSSQFAHYLYDKARVRRATIKLVTLALVQREGFVMPYFDPNVGPFTPDDITTDPKTGEERISYIGQGEIRNLVLSRSQVMWEPGMDFDDSPWVAIERARLIDEVKEIPGYLGGELTANATTADTATDKPSKDMVLVTEYMERPCPDYPNGRRLQLANDRQIAPEEFYPCRDPSGKVVDEPVLHRLSYTVNPDDDDDDRGLVEFLIDLARTIDDCWSKLIEWKNRCLFPQMTAHVNSLRSRRTDAPGEVTYYVGQNKPEWEKVNPPPPALFEILEMALRHMRAIASDVDVQAEPDVAARTAQAAIETARLRWQSFLGDLAEVHSRWMRHMLSLAALHYSEQRQIEIRGQYGWAPLPAFTGQDLRSQVNVRVLPESLEALNPARTMNLISFLRANWPDAIHVEDAIEVLNSGNPERLTQRFDAQKARANLMVEKFRQGPDVVMMMGERWDPAIPFPVTDENGMPVIDPMTGEPQMTQGGMVPSWMPRQQDHVPIHRKIFTEYMVTPDFDLLPVETQHFFNEYLAGLDFLDQIKAQKEAAQQVQMAESRGMSAATRPPGPPQTPDRVALKDPIAQQ